MFPFAWFVVGSMMAFGLVLGITALLTRDS